MNVKVGYTGECKHNHPISEDIIFELVDDFCIGEGTIHPVLSACQELWDPHRSEFIHVLNEMEDNRAFQLDIHKLPEDGVTIITDDSVTPIDVFGRINFEFYLSETVASRVALAHMVFTAHKLESERLMDKPVDSPVVVRTPEVTE